MSHAHTVSVNFHQDGGVDIYEAIDNVWGFIHEGSSPQSMAFARNVMQTLDKTGYLVKMAGGNAFEFFRGY